MRNKNPVNAVVVRGLGLIHEAIGLERSFGMEAVCLRQIVILTLLVMMLASTLATAQKTRQPQTAEDYVLMLKSRINTTGPRSVQANQFPSQIILFRDKECLKVSSN
jgi:hypothetical protein